MGSSRGWQAKATILYDGIEIGTCFANVSISITQELETYYEIENPNVVKIIFGKQKVEGALKRAWLNTALLELMGLTITPFSWTSNLSFTLKVEANIPGGPWLQLENCRLTKSSISIPQDGFLEEDYDFISIGNITLGMNIELDIVVWEFTLT